MALGFNQRCRRFQHIVLQVPSVAGQFIDLHFRPDRLGCAAHRLDAGVLRGDVHVSVCPATDRRMYRTQAAQDHKQALRFCRKAQRLAVTSYNPIGKSSKACRPCASACTVRL